MVISEPAANRVTGTATVYFAQRIEDEHGTFRGTVNVGVSPDRLLDAHAANAQVDGRSLVLARRDGVVLAHSQSPSAVGSRFPQGAPWYAAVASGGVLLYETFAQGNESVGRPSRPDFLLAPGELLTAAAGLRVVAYEDVFLTGPERFVQRIAAVREAPAAPERPRPYPLGTPSGPQ